MLCNVYPTRLRGERVPRAAVFAAGVQGHLAVWGNVFDRSITSELLAHVSAAPGGAHDLLPPLSGVRLLQVRRRGFLLWGTEHVRALDERRRETTAVYSQGWWCVPVLG